MAALAVKVLRSMFGESTVPDAVGCRHSAWNSEQFSMGSYSHQKRVAVGEQRASKVQSMASEVSSSSVKKCVDDVIFYSGEACHEVYVGTVHGAFLTGIREAGKILIAAEEAAVPDIASTSVDTASVSKLGDVATGSVDGSLNCTVFSTLVQSVLVSN